MYKRQRFNNWFSAYAGFTDSDRQIRFLEAFSFPSVAGSAVSDLYQQTRDVYKRQASP